jgi:hypothetical protein
MIRAEPAVVGAASGPSDDALRHRLPTVGFEDRSASDEPLAQLQARGYR